MTQAELDAQAFARVTRAERVKRVLITATAFMVVAVLALLLVLLAQIQTQQADTRRAADAAVATNEQVLDCVAPTGECFRRSQANTGDAVASINEITQYAAVCADRPGSQSLAAIRRCVADLIAAAGNG